MKSTKRDSDKTKQPQPEKKRPIGRPPKLVARIDDSPENVAKALFGIKSDKQDAPAPLPKKD